MARTSPLLVITLFLTALVSINASTDEYKHEENKLNEILGNKEIVFDDWSISYNYKKFGDLTTPPQPVMLFSEGFENSDYAYVFLGCVVGQSMGIFWYPQKNYIGPKGSIGLTAWTIGTKTFTARSPAVDNFTLIGKLTGYYFQANEFLPVIEAMKKGDELSISYSPYYDEGIVSEKVSLMGFTAGFNKLKFMCGVD